MRRSGLEPLGVGRRDGGVVRRKAIDDAIASPAVIRRPPGAENRIVGAAGYEQYQHQNERTERGTYTTMQRGRHGANRFVAYLD